MYLYRVIPAVYGFQALIYANIESEFLEPALIIVFDSKSNLFGYQSMMM